MRTFRSLRELEDAARKVKNGDVSVPELQRLRSELKIEIGDLGRLADVSQVSDDCDVLVAIAELAEEMTRLPELSVPSEIPALHVERLESLFARPMTRHVIQEINASLEAITEDARDTETRLEAARARAETLLARKGVLERYGEILDTLIAKPSASRT